MKLNQLSDNPGARKSRIRIGRGVVGVARRARGLGRGGVARPRRGVRSLGRARPGARRGERKDR
mgnify:CR=1 FL=1